MTLTYDYIVVGAGPAGCAVAARLSCQPGCRVLLIEAGRKPRNPLLSIPAAAAVAMRHARHTSTFATEAEPGLGGRGLPLIAGRAVGGGSAINGMMYLRGQPADFDDWRDEADCPGWGFDDVLPFFKRAEASDRGEGPWHGGHGPITITRGQSEFAIADGFLDAMANAGVPLVDDLNADITEGFGFYDAAVLNGRRATAGSYLRDVADKDSLHLLTGAQVTGLTALGDRISGVRYKRGRRHGEARASGEVILAAGCVGTTHLLLLSGIGPAPMLESHGIRVLADRREVGENLQNHVAYTLRYALDAPVTAFEYRRPLHALRAGTAFLAGRKGALAGLPCPVGGVMRSDPSETRADTQVILGAGIPGAASGLGAMLPGRSGFILMVNQGRPFSRGKITLRSADPLIPPMIQSGHLADPRDRTVLAQAVDRLRDLVAGNRIAGARPTDLDADRHIDRATLLSTMARRAVSYYHMAGAARMGHDHDAVVDLSLRVNGVRGLRIADTSVAPLLVNGNTTPLALMIGERAAQFVAVERGCASPMGSHFP